ncbi:MAG: YdcF family protein [Alphaproteobacteria bacterium]
MAFFLSKFLWVLVSPSGLLMLALTSGALLNFSHRPRLAKTGRGLCLFVALCLIAIALLPVGDWALTPLENRFAFNPPEQVDGIIVIGGDEKTAVTEARGMPTALDSMRRYEMVLDMSRRYPDAKLVFSGGSADVYPHGETLDSEIAREIMNDIGVPTDKMIFEKTSRNTYENAVFSADIVRPEPSQKWLLVTSAWHMTRAMGCFRKAGWNVYAAPTGYFTTGKYTWHTRLGFVEQMYSLTFAMHEYMGLAAYWLMGRTSSLWPN